MPSQHAKPQTGFRMDAGLKTAAKEKAAQDPGAGSLNAAVERLVEGYVAGTYVLPQPEPHPGVVTS